MQVIAQRLLVQRKTDRQKGRSGNMGRKKPKQAFGRLYRAGGPFDLRLCVTRAQSYDERIA